MSKKERAELMLRITPELAAKIRELAGRRGMSVNKFLTVTLEEFAAGEELPESAEERLTARIVKLENAVFGKDKK